ncbi:MAG: 4-alpha-glucanotransferase [Candidatus Velthaea sp.]
MNAIDERYVDAFGVERIVPQATRDAFAALLRPASGGERIIAPATVIRDDVQPAFVVSLPATSWTERLNWTIAHEDGTVARGTAELREAPVVGRFDRDRVPYDRRRITVAALPLGYHRIAVDAGVYGTAEAALIVVPSCVYVSPRERDWGIAIQLYTVRSARNWGIGDFTDLLGFIRLAADVGATYVGLNPLHAPHRNNPSAASPYAPTSRRFLNWLYIDVEAVPEAADPRVRSALCEPAFTATLTALRTTSIVDYAGVARAKDAILRRCFKVLGARPALDDDFRIFVRAGGVALERFAIFETLAERFGPHVADWPPTYRTPSTDDVKTFTQAERPAIEYAKYLQYHAGRQLEKAADFARRCEVELYRDLAVGVDPNGADAWIDAEAYVPSVSVGAPPDLLNPDGQDWGLPPLDPNALTRDGYRTVAELFRANMHAAGALRIDHAMSLTRLFWSLRGRSASEGTYVQYPFEDLLGVLALESSRAKCSVIGEDLGTVPDGFRERMKRAGVLSYRILFFERDSNGDFIPAERYPALSLAATGTHDLATFAAWLAGSDIDLRAALGVGDPNLVPRERAERDVDRQRLISTLRRCGDLDCDKPAAEDVLLAAHRFLARSPARIVMMQIEDAIGEVLPVNVPGTTEQYPNWRRKLSLDLETIGSDRRFAALCDVLRSERPRQATTNEL